MKQANRLSGKGKAYEGLVGMTPTGVMWTGKVRVAQDAMNFPLHVKKPSRIFVNSMFDLFHKDFPVSFIEEVFDVMNRCPQHRFPFLTKRSDLLKTLAPKLKWADNIWAGVTVENDANKYRIDDLKATKGPKIKWISFEPLIGDITSLDLTGIDWVVVGGESGPKFRPMDPDWARHIRDACVKQKVKFFFKQYSALHPKKLSRSLDGKVWSEFPV
jgi:protein gp37